MATAHDDKLLGFQTDVLFKLCLYYSYGREEIQDVAALFNKNYKDLPKISPEQLKDVYFYLHNIMHGSYKRARDLNRTNAKQLKKILKNELGFDTDRLSGRIIQPSKPMTGLKYVPYDKPKGKSRGGDSKSVREKTTLWCQAFLVELEEHGGREIGN